MRRYWREDNPGDKRLVAYIVTDGPAPSSGDLRSFLAARLPEYMVPSLYVSLEAVPRTPNGKLDRRRLPSPDHLSLRDGREHVAPRNSREQALAEICADVLKLERVGVDDNLFDLGADSIHLFQIVARANETGLSLTPKQVLSGRTVSAICADLLSHEIHDHHHRSLSSFLCRGNNIESRGHPSPNSTMGIDEARDHGILADEHSRTEKWRAQTGGGRGACISQHSGATSILVSRPS